MLAPERWLMLMDRLSLACDQSDYRALHFASSRTKCTRRRIDPATHRIDYSHEQFVSTFAIASCRVTLDNQFTHDAGCLLLGRCRALRPLGGQITIMDPTLIALALVVLLPIGWLASEFYENRSVRIALGVLAIATSFFVAFVVGSLEQLRSNTYFGDASKNLIKTTVTELGAGNSEQVLEHLKELQDKYHPTYETRAGYQELVDEYVAQFAAEDAER